MKCVSGAGVPLKGQWFPGPGGPAPVAGVWDGMVTGGWRAERERETSEQGQAGGTRDMTFPLWSDPPSSALHPSADQCHHIS